MMEQCVEFNKKWEVIVMKGQKFLKVTSILMIIGGVLAAITGLLALLGISALAAMAGSAEGTFCMRALPLRLFLPSSS